MDAEKLASEFYVLVGTGNFDTAMRKKLAKRLLEKYDIEEKFVFEGEVPTIEEMSGLVNYGGRVYLD